MKWTIARGQNLCLAANTVKSLGLKQPSTSNNEALCTCFTIVIFVSIDSAITWLIFAIETNPLTLAFVNRLLC